MRIWKALPATVLLFAATALPAVAEADATAGNTPMTITIGCGEEQRTSTYGGEAQWVTECTRTQIRLNGEVRDTVADRKCAKVTAYFPDGSTWSSPSACTKGDYKYFLSPWYVGRTVNAYLVIG